MIFGTTLQNHAWNGVIIPLCQAQVVRADINEGLCTTYTEYFSVVGEDKYFLTMINDTFEVDLEQPLKPQIIAYFGAIFNPQPKNEGLWNDGN